MAEGKHKIVLISIALAGLVGLSVLVILWPRTRCDGIFHQTAPSVEANLEVIKNRGHSLSGKNEFKSFPKAHKRWDCT